MRYFVTNVLIIYKTYFFLKNFVFINSSLKKIKILISVILLLTFLSNKAYCRETFQSLFIYPNSKYAKLFNINEITNELSKNSNINHKFEFKKLLIQDIQNSDKKIGDYLKRNNFQLVIGLDYVFSDILYKYSFQHPKINFFAKDTLKYRKNYNNFHIRFFEIAFILSKINKEINSSSNILIIVDNKTPSNVAAINAIAIGARNKNKLSNTNLIFLKNSKLKKQISEIDLILKKYNFSSIFLLVNNEKTIHHFRENKSIKSSIFSLNTIGSELKNDLVNEQFNIDYNLFFYEIIDSIILRKLYDKKSNNLNFKKNFTRHDQKGKHLGFRGNYIKENFNKLSIYNVNTKIKKEIEAIKNFNNLHFQNIFIGPLKSTNGTIVLGKDQFLKQRDLESFNWLVNDINILQ